MRGRERALGYGLLALLFLGLFLRFNANAVQSGDAWIVYLPGAKTLSDLDLAHFRETIAFGNAARAPMLIAAIAVIQKLTFGALSDAQSAQLAVTLCGAIFAAVLLVRGRREGGGLLAIAATLMVLCAPPVLPTLLYTTPDTLFGALWLGIVFSILDDRPNRVLGLYLLAMFTRGNGLTLAPGVLIYLAYRYRAGLPKAPLYFAGAIGVPMLYNAFSRWVRSGASILRTPVTEWHPGIFLEGRYEGILVNALQFKNPAQYLKITYRILIAGPLEILKHAYFEDPLTSWVAPILLLLGALTLAAKTVRALRAERKWLSPKTAVLVTAAAYYVPIIVFHWEARYLLPLYASLIFWGTLSLSKLQPSRVWEPMLLGLSVVLTIVMFVQIEARFAPRTSFGLDDEGYTLRKAQDVPQEQLKAMSEMVSHRPIHVARCGAMPLQYFNYHRYRDYTGKIECTGWHFRRPRTWNDIDFFVRFPDRDASALSEREQHLIRFGKPIATLNDDGVLLMRNALSRLYPDSLGARSLALRFEDRPPRWRVTEDGFILDPKPGEGAEMRSQQFNLGRSEVISSRFRVTSDGRMWRKLQVLYEVDGVLQPGLALNRHDADGLPVSVAYLCEAPRCEARLVISAVADEKKRIQIHDLRAAVLNAPFAVTSTAP